MRMVWSLLGRRFPWDEAAWRTYFRSKIIVEIAAEKVTAVVLRSTTLHLVGGFWRGLGGPGRGAIGFDEVGVPGQIALETVLDVGRQGELVVFVGVDD